MKNSIRTLSLTTLALLFSLAITARAQLPTTTSGPAGHEVRIPPAPHFPQVILYDQYDNFGANATSSQDFEAAFDSFDDQLADDFVVPASTTWSVESVDADGLYFNGAGPAENFNVYFYSDSGGLPGALVDSRIGMSYVQVGSTFTVTLSPAVSLASGTYWVAVQARMDFTPFGEWGWTDRTVQSNSGAAWENPGGGFGTSCTPSWGRKTDCVPTFDPDQVYRLNGTIGGGGGLTYDSAFSEKGVWDIDLPLTGGGVEDRRGGPHAKYEIYFVFNNNLVSVGSATTTCGSVGNATVDPDDAHQVVVDLVNVRCGKAFGGDEVTVTANDLVDDQGNTLASASITFCLLLGDVNGDGVVDSADAQQTRADLGQSTDATNFREDVDNSGVIDAKDATIVKKAQGTSCP